ncbi:DNA polymerase ligase N-terminal domain-containing protein [Flavobacterium sp. 83]|jgi:DNA ligase D-like protein (predicted 3'-phosphoesterase)|uniref:DNA polymerase ligase N-terminal domain-containing protein n=1 Tax=Flavobacterium sp. 83 TaxID=1131812 RepID=UPI000A9F56EE|nr:DNA polymerase ligase N-terminal domain-containing protein [Flavobacterium sp. 83]
MISLNKYNQKRNFNTTAEPESVIKKSITELVFVVQKHAASHLHYDFRMEMDGVLKSWVIPKGPSMNPVDKRLAIMVEDHPYDYKDFEGIIPDGNYGAGTVMIWDNGTYTLADQEGADNVEKKLKSDFEKGHLSFILNGKKLKGEFALVELNTKDENTWLLIKKNDQFACNDDVLQEDKSVISNLTLENLESFENLKN